MSNPVFRRPRFNYEVFAERYSLASAGQVVEVTTVESEKAGRSRQVSVIHYLQRAGLSPQQDFQTTLSDNTVYVKKLSSAPLEV